MFYSKHLVAFTVCTGESFESIVLISAAFHMRLKFSIRNCMISVVDAVLYNVYGLEELNINCNKVGGMSVRYPYLRCLHDLGQLVQHRLW
jgi:hypothetical protein